MPTVDLSAARLDIVGVVGDDLSVTFTVTEGGSAFGWSGASVATAITTAAGTEQVTDFTVTNSVDGTLVLALTDANTTTLGEGAWAYRVSVTKNGDTRTWLSGTLRLLPAHMSGSTPTATTATLSIDTSATATLSITGGVTGPTGPAGDALERNRYSDWSGALGPIPAEDTPTISVTTGSTTSITNGVLYREARVDGDYANALDPDGDLRFRYKAYPPDGASPVGADPSNFVAMALKPGGASQVAYWPWCIEFDTDALEVEFRQRFASSNQGMMLRVNGRWYSETEIARTGSAGATVKTKLTFPTAKQRRVEVWFAGDCGWGGAWISPSSTIESTDYPIQRRVAFIGDSFVNGSGSAPTGATIFETWPLRVAAYMGADEVILAGVGGTQWEPLGSGTADELVSHFGGDRLTDVLAMDPHVIVFAGSRNDDDVAAVATAVANALALCTDVAEVYVSGTATALAVNSRVKLGAENSGRPFVDLSAAIYGAGNTASPASDGGNADTMIGADGIHPTHAGHKLLADRFVLRSRGAADAELADETLLMPASMFVARTGSPARNGTAITAADAWFFDASSNEQIVGTFYIPRSWSLFDVQLVGANDASGSGDVRFNVQMYRVAAGGVLSGTPSLLDVNVAFTAGADGVAQFTTMRENMTRTPAGLVNVRITRDASNVADTLGNDYGVLGLLFVKRN